MVKDIKYDQASVHDFSQAKATLTVNYLSQVTANGRQVPNVYEEKENRVKFREDGWFDQIVQFPGMVDALVKGSWRSYNNLPEKEVWQKEEGNVLQDLKEWD